MSNFEKLAPSFFLPPLIFANISKVVVECIKIIFVYSNLSAYYTCVCITPCI